jgi:hypothetical protein
MPRRAAVGHVRGEQCTPGQEQCAQARVAAPTAPVLDIDGAKRMG